MSRPFTTTLRTPGDVITIGAADAPRLTLRVQWLDGWQTVAVAAPATTPVAEVVAAAMRAMDPHADLAAFVTKHEGIEVLDGNRSLADVGVPDGGILSVAMRRRRPVR